MGKLYAYADLPRTGLCNMLNVWARAFLWAKDHGAEMIAPQWVKLSRIGPLLRWERDKRYYLNQFSNLGYVKGLSRWMALHLNKMIPEQLSEGVKDGVVLFSGQHHDLLDVCTRREELYAELLHQAVPSIKMQLGLLPAEYIAVHVRRGDFKTIGRILPGSYYVNAIRFAVLSCRNIPILVFSDARTDELDFLHDVGEEIYRQIRIMKTAPALHDVLALSGAKLFVCTNGSSFSEWAACLGGMPTIWSKNGILINEKKFTGPITYI